MRTIALAGNPNTGKTSLFNTLTKSYEYVGNWSGVTVEKKVGLLRNKQGQLVDLPGIYSLHPVSSDEGVAANFLLTESPDAVLNIIDSSQLERNFYLTVQLLEYNKPFLIGLNMIDVAKARGIYIDSDKLSNLLQVPVLPIVARTGQGTNQMLSHLSDPNLPVSQFQIPYGPIVEQAITACIRALPQQEGLPDPRWLSLQFLENNPVVIDRLTSIMSLEPLRAIYEQTEEALRASGEALHLPQFIRSVRMDFIRQLMDQCVDKRQSESHTLTERIDAIITHKWLGLPIFLAFMFLLFKLTFDWFGQPLSDVLDGFIGGPVSDLANQALTAVGASEFTHALIVDGIIAGVGGVLVFVPQIFMLFFLISLVEDSGYMARVTLVMDRVMEMVGLNGKAFIPFIIGFGCNVPAVMAARSIEQPKERLVTTLLTPLMSCSARLPVYSLFAGAFFISNKAVVVFSLYLLGIVMALALAKLFTHLFYTGEKSIFVIEIPPYRMPQARSLLRNTWEKGKGFIRKAGTFILGGSVVIWFLSYAGPSGFGVDMDHSFLAWIGGLFAPILAPLGFGTWQAGASLLTGFMAKEVVVSTMNIIYHTPDMSGLETQIKHAFSPLQAYSFMAFILLYVPCLATVGVIRKETASMRWTLFSIGYGLTLAYIVSVLIYQIGRWIGLT
ncbi:ferrous iron transport protein B [Paenibacillus guangzhouensis]|uniref:ferrous iron transport protein B n=1 Tax=Paenibacillus guangzhouensis TaxID=1473112 RepID=UPI001266FFA3|nr:ferrous iron transport protein B [Paenibacillus guangzhouensis]